MATVDDRSMSAWQQGIERHLEAIDRLFESVDRRFASIERRLGTIEADVTAIKVDVTTIKVDVKQLPTKEYVDGRLLILLGAITTLIVFAEKLRTLVR